MPSKEAYQAKYEAQRKEWEAQMALLRAKAQRVGVEARIAIEREIEGLKLKQAAARAKWDAHGPDALQDVKIGARRAIGELRQAIEQAAARFK